MIGLFLLHKTSFLPLTTTVFYSVLLFYSVILSVYSVIPRAVEGPRERVRHRNNSKAFSPRTRSPSTI